MKIALIGNEFLQQFPLVSYGGIESSVEATAWGLYQVGADFCCVVPQRKDPKIYPFEIIDTSFSPASVSGRPQWEFMKEVAGILEYKKPDIVWSQSIWSMMPIIKLGIPTIATIQDSGDGSSRGLIKHKLAFYRFISRFQYGVWVTEDWQERNSFHVYSSLTDDEFAFGTDREGYFLWVAGLNWGWRAKGLHLFIELAIRNRDKYFVAYGVGDRKISTCLKLLEKVVCNFEFRGELRRGEQHAEAFRKARALIMPTQIPEALGRTVLESLSKGTPVIASANGALPELVQYPCGLCSNSFDTLQAALNMDFDNSECYRYSKRFSARNEVRQMLSMTDRILTGTV